MSNWLGFEIRTSAFAPCTAPRGQAGIEPKRAAEDRWRPALARASKCVIVASVPLRFEWDERKARSNATKHSVSFDDASTIFADALSLTIRDPDHSQVEDRFVTVGRAHRGE